MVVAVAFVAVGCADHVPAGMAVQDRENGLIAFARGGFVYTLDPETGETTPLSAAPSPRGLTWSPDGTRIALEINPDGTGTRIAVLNVEDGSLDEVADELHGTQQQWFFGAEHPSWSPDGSKLAFDASLMAVDDVRKEASKDIPETSMACFRSYVYVVDLDTGAVEQVTDGLTFDFAPTWAPDGSAIAFERFPFPTPENSDPDPQMLLVDPEDGTISRLQPAGQTWASDLSWSPDGDRLLLHDGDGHIDVLDLGTMEVARLATATVSDRELGDPT